MTLLTITEEMLDNGKSSNGGYSKKQIKLLGEDATVSGWRERIIGKSIAEENFNLFLSLKNAHLKPKDKIQLNKSVICPHCKKDIKIIVQ